ncbi:MAG TPA: AAA family ATPase, partial [Chloroflexota bacterium]
MATDSSRATASPSSQPSLSALLTFLIADVRGYTTFTVERGDEAAARLATRFAEITEEVVAAHDGEVIELRGDEALAAFTSPRQAVRAAINLQRRFASESNATLPLQVGVGLDAGEALPVKGGYRGGALNLAARLCSLARAGEVLASDAVTHLAGKMEGLSCTERGQVELKGFADPVTVMQVVEVHGPGTETEELAGEETSRIAVQDFPIGGFLGALPANPLAGREEELGEVLASIEVVIGGAGRLVMLAGEPGAGKTRLAQEVTLHLRNQGFLLAPGSCFEPKQSVPYYPFLDIVAALYSLVPPAVRSQAAQRWPYIGRLLPETGIPSPPPSDEQDDQERLFRAVTAFIQTVAQQVPVAILLDDLHWSDGASLDLLQHITRHTRGDRVLICATYRDVEVGRQHPLERTLQDLHRQGLMERIAVRRLDQDQTRALVASTFGQEQVSKEFAALIYRHTEGNPFFTQEVLRSLVERGDIYREDGRWERREVAEIEVPESVRAVIGQRLSRLQEDTQDLLREASVLGSSFGFDELHSMGGRPEEAVELAIEEAAEAGILRETGRDVYSFNHALTQQTLYAELSGRRRRRLHLAAGEALERLPERDRTRRAAELAWHFLEGEDAERALRYSMLAGANAEEVYAREEAVLHYRRAVEPAQELAANNPSRRKVEAEALFKLGRMLAITDRHPEAQRILEDAAQKHAALGDPLMEGSTLGIAEISYHQSGMSEQAQDAATRVALLLPAIEASEPSADLVDFWRVQGLTCGYTARYEDCLSYASKAVEVARVLGDPALLREAEIQRASALGMSGHLHEAIAAAEAVIPWAEASNDLDTLLAALFAGAEFS